jgi:hypothetical protein
MFFFIYIHLSKPIVYTPTETPFIAFPKKSQPHVIKMGCIPVLSLVTNSNDKLSRDIESRRPFCRPALMMVEKGAIRSSRTSCNMYSCFFLNSRKASVKYGNVNFCLDALNEKPT